METRQIRIEFLGLSDAEAEAKAERLAEALTSAAVKVPVERLPDPRRQSAGIILAVSLGPPTALLIAATIENFISRDDTSIRVTADAKPIFEGGRESASQLRPALSQASTR